MTAALLLTGSTGFVGGAVLAALRHHDWPVRRLVRRSTGSDDEIVADLARPASLKGVCDGVSAIVHCGGYVGQEPELCRRVNVDGTEALVAEAVRAGVPTVVSLSTAAVYGPGPHRGSPPGDLPLRPATALSESRAAGDHLVRAAGGRVVRPHLVYGPGDRWVVPALAGLLTTAPHLDSAAHSSMVHVGDLGRAIAALALRPPDGAEQVYHANHPIPVAMRDVAKVVRGALGLPRPTRTPEPAGSTVPARHTELFTVDHWFDSEGVWIDTGCDPGPAPIHGLAATLAAAGGLRS